RDGEPISGAERDEALFALRAFHASPFEFNRFSMEHIGTGEGNQAFFFGLYLAQNPKVILWYEDMFGKRHGTIKVDGEDYDATNPRHLAARHLRQQGGRRADAIDKLEQEESAAASRGHEDVAQRARAAAEFLRGAADDDLPEYQTGAHTYEVVLHVNEDELLDWDAPLSSQSEAVQTALRSLGVRERTNRLSFGGARSWPTREAAERIAENHARANYTIRPVEDWQTGRTVYEIVEDVSSGAQAYDDLIALKGSPEAATQALREAGIPGGKYLDADSRLHGDGTRNIVMFSDELIEIVRRDGKRVTGAEREEIMASLGSRPLSFRPGRAAAPTARAQAAMPEIREDVEKAISRTLPPEVKARVRERITFGDLPERLRPEGQPLSREIEGLYDPHEKIVYVSLNALDPVATARHESMHALRSLGLLSPEDWGRLTAEAERRGLRGEYGIDDLYGEVYGQRYAGDEARLEEALNEETIAEMFARRDAGENFGGPLNRIMDRIIKFLRAVRDALGLRGFRTVQDVFEDIEAGAFARRETARAVETSDNLSRAADAMLALGGPDPARVRANVEKLLRDENVGAAFTEDILREFDDLARDFGDEGRAAGETAARLKEAAAQKKRQDLLQQRAVSEIFRVMLEFRDARGQPDPAFAMRAILEHHGEVNMPRGMKSLDGHRKAVLGNLIQDMDEAFHRMRPKLSSGLPRDEALQARIVDEVFGIDTGDPDAKAFAQAWQEAVEKARQRFNAAGGGIARREDWRFPQGLDAAKLLGMGEEEFVRRTLDRLDLEQMRHPLSEGPPTRSDAEKMLRHVYQEIITDGWAHSSPSARRRGLSKIANRRGDHRVLVYKDAASYREQMADFGTGDNMFERMTSHLELMARDIAAMEVLGPNPEAALEWMTQFVTQQAHLKAAGAPAVFPETRPIAAINRSPLSYASANIKRARDMWTVYRGGLGVPESAEMASIFATGRNIVSASLLGHAQISALGDIGLQMQARKFAGLPQTRAIAGIARNLSGDKREIQRAGIMVEGYLNRIDAGGRSRISVQGTRWSQVLTDRVITFSGLKSWTEANQRSFQEAVMGALADSAGRGFDALDADARRLLRRYGIEAGDWDRLRSSIPAQDDGSPGLWLRPADVARAEAAAGREGDRLAERYAAMLMQEAQFTSPTTTLRSRAVMTWGTRAGGMGEALRWLSQFKGFPIMMHQLWMERIAREFYAGNTGR
ncbi:MAG: hypothetical protein ACLFPA_12560, partial [Dichotomicrobium sp.]